MSSVVVESHAGEGMLTQLAYRSLSVSNVSSGMQMSEILDEARPRNAALSITGVLTVVNGVFVQVIEGPEASIDRLLSSLSRDPRHTDLTVLGRRCVTRRAFADLDMVSPKLAVLEAAQLSLLLATGSTSIDDLIVLLGQALSRQDAVLDGVAVRPAPDKPPRYARNSGLGAAEA